MAVRF